MRVGAVSYLNSKPLIQGLDQQLPDGNFVLDLPSRLADRLGNGDLDVALIPVVEAAGSPGYTVVSDACIACRGPVWSVKLLSRIPFESIQTLALDEGSRTSVALAKVLLHRRYALKPSVIPFPIGADMESLDADAVLIIGDRAMDDFSDTFSYHWDLGEEWIKETGLPFVFAVWTARQFGDHGQLDRLLSEARNAGVESISRIALEESRHYDLSEHECSKYLNQNLHFHMGESERAGLSFFLDNCRELGLIDSSSELSFYDCQTT